MSYVFLSYKREDEDRAFQLVRAFKREGIDVWWDQDLPVAEEWRENLATALDSAACVIVLWSYASVGPEGSFVRDEANRAYGSGNLIPVRIDKVEEPLGFGELQSVDLRHWRRNRRDPFFRDLVAAVQARMDGRPVPPPRGHIIRLARRAIAGSVAFSFMVMIGGFGLNSFGSQDRICALSIGQPIVSDICGATGLGHRPNKAERMAWEGQAKGSCDALREHIRQFPDGAYRSRAADLLAGAKLERSASPMAVSRVANSYVRENEISLDSEKMAKAAAFTRAEQDAARTICLARDENEKVTGINVEPIIFSCRPGFSGGFKCGLDYRANCLVEVSMLEEICG